MTCFEEHFIDWTSVPGVRTCGQSADKVRTKCGQRVDRGWTEGGQRVDNKWTKDVLREHFIDW